MRKLFFVLYFFVINFNYSNNNIDSPFLTNYTITVTASSNSSYTLSGTDLNGTVSGDDPALTFNVGDQITFSVNASGHPFYLKTTAGTGTGNQASNVTNNGTESGDVVWTPNAAGTYYYQCSAHSGMVGTITINSTEPSVTSIVLDETSIAENGSTATLTGTISAAHSKDVTIPLTITGTATIDTDYSTAFVSKGITTVAGGDTYGSDLNKLYTPRDVSLDSSGNIYVADFNNGRIMKWAAGASEGINIISVSSPWGIHVVDSNTIYVSSYYNHAVYKYTYADEVWTQSTVAGGNGRGTELNKLNYPTGVHVDSAGNVYVADRENQRIVKWAVDATVGEVVAGGNGVGNALNQLYPYGLTVDDSGNVYVADYNNYRIVKWAPDATEGVIFANSIYSFDLEFDSDGNLYSVDYSNHQIKKFSPGASSGVVIAGTGSNGSGSDQFYYPTGIGLDSSGNVYVADSENHRVQKIKINPEITITAGETTGTVTFTSLSDFDDEDDETIIITPSTTVTNATSDVTTVSTVTITDNDDPPSVSFAWSFPSIKENSSEDVTLTATLSRVSGKTIEIPYTVGGTATETTEFTVSSSPITIAPGSTTATVTVSTSGLDDTDVEVLETIILTFGTLVNATSSETDVTLSLISDDKPSVTGITLDKTEIAEDGSEAILTATISEGHSKDVIIPLTISGTAELNSDYSTEFGSKGTKTVAGGNGRSSDLNAFYNPYGLAIDNSGNIYVADHNNSRIMKWIPGAIEGIKIASASYPYDIQVDSNGNVYYSELYGARVVKLTYENDSYESTVVAGGNGGGSSLNQLNYPKGIHVDSTGNIYIADSENHRIVMYEPGNIEGLVVAGENGQGNGSNQLSWPEDIVVDSNQNIYISNSGNTNLIKWKSGSSDGVVVNTNNYNWLSLDSFDNIYLSNGQDIFKLLQTNDSYTTKLISSVSSSNIRALYLDSIGNIYFSETNNHKIGKITIVPELFVSAGETTGTVTFKSINEVSDEEDETIIITPSSTVTNATSSETDVKTITITDDDDVPSVSFAFSSPSIDEDSSTDVTLTATLSVVSGKPIEIPFTVSGTATLTDEFTISDSPISIEAGSTTGTVTVSTTGLDDTDVEVLETIILTFGTLVNSTTTETDVTLNLLSDDNPSVTSIELDKTTILEDGSTATLTGTISAAHSKDVTIPLTITGTATIDTDYSTAFVSKGITTVAGGDTYGSDLNKLYTPRDVSLDSSGNIYVADFNNGRIMKWAPGASEGVNIFNVFDPWGIHVVDSNTIYVSSYYNHAVYKYTYADEVWTQSTVAGGNGRGTELNKLNYPTGVHVDSAGNVYVADRENQRIVKWAVDATVGEVVAGGNGVGNALNQLYPYGLTVDDSGNVYVADYNNYRIVKWAPDATEGVIFANSIYSFDLEFDSDGNLYSVDYSNHQIKKFSPGASSGVVIAGTGSNGSGSDQFYYPTGIGLDSSGNVYVADSENHRVQKIKINPEITITAGETTGTVAFTSIVETSFEYDETIIITPSTTVTNATSDVTTVSTVTITDASEPPSVTFAFSSPSIEENSSTDVTLTATLSKVSGKPIEIPFTVSGTATLTDEFTISDSPISIPAGSTTGTVTISTNGLDDSDVELIETIILTFGTLVNATSETTDVTLNLLSDDNPTLDSIEYDNTSFAEHQTIKITGTISEAHSKNITVPLTISGTATIDTDYSTAFASKGITTVAGGDTYGSDLNKLYNPRDVSLDSSGNIYVTDMDNYRIIKWAPGASEGVNIFNVSGPWGIHVVDSNTIYVSSYYNHAVYKYTYADEVWSQSTVAGGNGRGTELNKLDYPTGVHVDSAGNVYVVDRRNDRIVKWAVDATVGEVVAGGNGVGNALNQLYNPRGLTVDGSGNVYVADYNNYRIVKWAPDATEGVIFANSIYSFDLEFDSDGNLYSVDYSNHQIKKFSPGASSGVVIAGTGSNGSGSDQFYYPTGIGLDSSGNVYVADSENHRVQKIKKYPEIFIESGSTTGVLSITGIEDRVDEEDETIIVTPGSSVSNVVSSITEETTITLLDNSITLTQKDDPFNGLSKSSVSWGDFDNDGDKDVAIMGQSNTTGAFTDIYKNDEGTFSRMDQNFENMYDGDLSWVDLNKDGFLDLVVSGYNKTPLLKIYMSKNNAQYFEESENSYGLPELFSSNMAWGDLDNDGDIDLAITGIDSENNSVFSIYYRVNDADNFEKETQFSGNSNVGSSNSYLEIVDIDFDGDNDIKYAGGTVYNSFFRTSNNQYNWWDNNKPTKNASIGFVKQQGSGNLNYFEMGEKDDGSLVSNDYVTNYIPADSLGVQLKLKNGDIAVGDYDNNGTDDVVFTGEDENGVPITKLYEAIPSSSYDNANGFSYVESSIKLTGLRESTADWVDYDMDGDLDLFLTGIDNQGAKTILYETEIRNKDNVAPPKVTGLKAEDLGNGKIKFSWDVPSDDFSNNIGYVLRLGTTSGGTELSNTFSNLSTGNRLISLPPPIYSNSYETILDPGTYYFAVQAIDGGLKAGEFSDESSYTLKYEWKLLNQGGIVDRRISGYENPVMKIGDIDNDGDLDLIYGAKSSGNYNDNYTKVFKFDGTRLIGDANNNDYWNGGIQSSSSITDIDIDDINSDGQSDVVINSYREGSTSNITAYIADESGNLVQYQIDSGLHNGKVKIIDMNNDGTSEVVLIGLTADNTSGKPKIYIYELNNSEQGYQGSNNGYYSFTKIDISDQVDELTYASYDLGDVDNDQDIDIIISGFDESQGLKAYIYKNIGKAGLTYELEKTTNNIAAIRDGTVDFVDFDSDGDLDAAISGTGLQGDIFEIYKNDLNEGKENWPRIDLGLTGMRNGKTDLGDFNGDGYTDIIYSGLLEGLGKVTKLAEYTSESNSYVDSPFDVSDIIEASVEFGDIDGDGDLDFILSGEDKDGNGNVFRAYLNNRNESAAVEEPKSGSRAGSTEESTYVENAPPSVPEIISTKILLSEQTKDGNLVVEFSWNASTDDLTPVDGLTYALKIGTTENGEEIMSSNSNPNGLRKTAEKGNAEHNLKWKVSLPSGEYYWSVQAIDASYNGSKFSEPRKFISSSDLKLGDSNGDDSVNILDLTNIIDKILGNSVNVWVQETSDINDDGKIDVVDISGLISIILNSSNSGIPYGTDPDRNLNYISSKPVGDLEIIYSGNKVFFESENEVTAIQFSINKSVEYSFSKELKENFSIISFEKDGNLNHLIYSNDNKSLLDYSNIIFSYVDKSLKDYEISEIKAASIDGLSLNTIYKDESYFDTENDLLKVYPNPTQNNLNILGSIENEINIIDVKIYNLVGVVVYEKSFDSIDRFRELDLSNLISGVYLIEINSLVGKEINKTQIYKFVKN